MALRETRKSSSVQQRKLVDSLRQLDALNAYPASTTREDNPFPGFQPRICQSAVHGGSSTHDRSSDFIWHTIRNSRRIKRWARLGDHGQPVSAAHHLQPRSTHDILLISPRNLHASVQPVATPLLNPGPALLTIVADIPHRLHTRPIPNLPALDLLTHLDNYAGAFVSGRVHAKVLHLLWQRQVVEHVVHIAHAEAGAVHAEQQFVRPRDGDVDIADFEVEVWAWVDDDAGFAFLGDLGVAHFCAAIYIRISVLVGRVGEGCSSLEWDGHMPKL